MLQGQLEWLEVDSEEQQNYPSGGDLQAESENSSLSSSTTWMLDVYN